ncbi:hypothetical protein GOP47_0005374 [Adiantum capillus-veneris]|uniref:Uncharacterized protein n=1 Tax=Adiantum capillus-veneris TaxID=13818 RepID=A0A9D4V5L2_ADICA|nr:hypothetical protein GOP47_0005374 [Adiantum capillus-veneris]
MVVGCLSLAPSTRSLVVWYNLHPLMSWSGSHSFHQPRIAGIFRFIGITSNAYAQICTPKASAHRRHFIVLELSC